MTNAFASVAPLQPITTCNDIFAHFIASIAALNRFFHSNLLKCHKARTARHCDNKNESVVTGQQINRFNTTENERHVYNNHNDNHDDIYSAVMDGASHMREFTVVPLGQSRSAPGGRQLVGQAANLTLESVCRLL